MKKFYTHPEFEAIKILSDDVLLTSMEQADAESDRVAYANGSQFYAAASNSKSDE